MKTGGKMSNTKQISKIDKLNQHAEKIVTSEPQNALSIAENAHQLAKSIDYQKGIGESLFNQGVSHGILGNHEKSLGFILEAKAIFEQTKDYSNQIKVWNSLGNIYLLTGELEKCLNAFNQCTILCKKTHNRNWEAISYGSTGNAYFDMGNYEVALDYFLKSLRLKQRLNISDPMILNNIANVYFALNAYEKALKNYLKGLKISRDVKNANLEATILDNIGFSYFKLDDTEKALEYAAESLKICQAMGFKGIATGTLNKIGTYHQETGNLQKALAYYQQSLELCETIGFKYGAAHNLFSIGTVQIQQKQHENAFASLEDALDLTEEIKIKDLVYKIHEELSRLYQQTGDLENALHHHRQFHQIKEEVFNENSDKHIRALQIRFETEQKEKELEIYRLKTQQQTRKLAALARRLSEKNELIRHLQQQASELGTDTKISVETLLEHLQETQSTIENWHQFQEEFDQVYPEFIPRLTDAYPDLTRQEIRICALIKIGLTSKEIAKILFISKRSVDSHRYNIRKKLNLSSKQLNQFILEF
jgi:tetratricopeptide (TPR) repeat protein/DNA-binding CsgD family transcriptional regulator